MTQTPKSKAKPKPKASAASSLPVRHVQEPGLAVPMDGDQSIIDPEWTYLRYEAAAAVAEGRLTFKEISMKLGIEAPTLQTWRKDPVFIDRVNQIRRTFSAGLIARGLAERQYRVNQLNWLFEKYQIVLRARAIHCADMERRHKIVIPGGETGLINPAITTTRSVTGSISVSVDASVDNATVREMRAIMQQTATEVGQWTEKHAVVSDNVERRYVSVDIDQV